MKFISSLVLFIKTYIHFILRFSDTRSFRFDRVDSPLFDIYITEGVNFVDKKVCWMPNAMLYSNPAGAMIYGVSCSRNTLFINYQCLKIKGFTEALIKHEEGHVYHNAFYSADSSFEDKLRCELLADDYMLNNCDKTQLMYFYVFLKILCSLLTDKGSKEFRINVLRLDNIRKYLGV